MQRIYPSAYWTDRLLNRIGSNCPPPGVVATTLRCTSHKAGRFFVRNFRIKRRNCRPPILERREPRHFIASRQTGRLMLTVLGGLAEFERELITRTGEGRA